MISYWTTREIARDTESGKTAVLSSGIFSIIGFLIFLLIAFFVSKPTGTNIDILYFSAIMIPFSFVNRTLSSISLGWKPHVNSYGVIIFDIVKIPAALFFIIFLDLGLTGVILVCYGSIKLQDNVEDTSHRLEQKKRNLMRI